MFIKKPIFIIGLLLSFSSQAIETLRFATSPTNPPFEYLNAQNTLTGFDIDIANALCQELKTECSFSKFPFDSLIMTLKLNRVDVIISSMDITAERSKQILFSEPYYTNMAVFIGKKAQFQNDQSLYHKRIGLQNGTTHQRYIQEKLPDSEVVIYESYQAAVLDLNNNRIDAVFGDQAVTNEWLKEYPSLMQIGQPINDPDYFGLGLGIGMQKTNTALATKLNSALNTLKQNGTYQTIYDKWFAEN